jgi:hypothetical protein
MKILLCIFLISVYFSNASVAQYTVTKVIGHVKKKSGEALVTGTVLTDNDELQFSSPNDMVRVIVAGKGIYVLNSSQQAETKQNQVIEILKYTMRVKSKEGYLSGRGESVETIPDVFDLSMGENKKILVRNTNRYLFSPQTYSVDNGGRFILQVSHGDDKPVIHVLKTVSDTLLLLAEDFKTAAAGSGDMSQKFRYSLGYYSRQKGTTAEITDIDPYFDSTGETEAIIKVIIHSDKNDDLTKLRQEAYDEVWTDLGKPSQLDFQNMFTTLAQSENKKH